MFLVQRLVRETQLSMLVGPHSVKPPPAAPEVPHNFVTSPDSQLSLIIECAFYLPSNVFAYRAFVRRIPSVPQSNLASCIILKGGQPGS
ncbi:hypothetical protein Zmor_027698 [Zophobas morio]|uniref:Uncharacterized protein n=1 Tax=Zophobas morio TaxID=2755281 RepID=A0AA38M2B0_9CUCU|nr:hypothetical protein Zmor_027698 [Zophobas morio]